MRTQTQNTGESDSSMTMISYTLSTWEKTKSKLYENITLMGINKKSKNCFHTLIKWAITFSILFLHSLFLQNTLCLWIIKMLAHQNNIRSGSGLKQHKGHKLDPVCLFATQFLPSIKTNNIFQEIKTTVKKTTISFYNSIFKEGEK